MVLRHNYYLLHIFLVPGLWKHQRGALVTWNRGPVFSTLGSWEESTYSSHMRTPWWCADVMLEGGGCKEDTDKCGVVFIMSALGDGTAYPRTMSRDCLEKAKTAGSKGEWAIRSQHLASLPGLIFFKSIARQFRTTRKANVQKFYSLHREKQESARNRGCLTSACSGGGKVRVNVWQLKLI